MRDEEGEHEVEYMSSQRSFSLLVVDGYKFSRHKHLNGSGKLQIRWRCTKTPCKSSMKTDESCQVLKYPTPHNHPPLPKNVLRRQMLSNGMKKVSAADMPSVALLPSDFQVSDLNPGDIALVKKNVVRSIKEASKKAVVTSPEVEETHSGSSSGEISNIDWLAHQNELSNFVEEVIVVKEEPEDFPIKEESEDSEHDPLYIRPLENATKPEIPSKALTATLRAPAVRRPVRVIRPRARPKSPELQAPASPSDLCNEDFGKYIGANLNKLPESVASITRLKIHELIFRASKFNPTKCNCDCSQNAAAFH